MLHREREVDGGQKRADGETSRPRHEGSSCVVGPGPRAGVEGVVLAGVHAWGECVLESVTCRPLFPVAGWPLISHTLAWLRDGGISRASVCANSDTSALRRSLGDGDPLKLNLHYYEDKMPRGPAGCARDAVINSTADTFVVVEGTVVPSLDMADLIASHRASGAVLTVVVSNGENDRKPNDGLEPIGVYVFSRSVLAHIPPTGYQDIKESLIPRLHAQGQSVGTYVVGHGASPRVTNAASYLAVSKWAVERLTAGERIPEGYVRLNQALVHESARLDGQTRFIGPVLVGPRCRIEEGAMMIGPTCLGADCHVAAHAVVSRSILWDKCEVGEGAVLDHCILTNGAVVPAQTTVRETVCLARPRQRTWRTWLRSLLGRKHGPRRSVQYVSPAGPRIPPAVKARPRPVGVNTDKQPVGALPVVSQMRVRDR